MTTPAFDPRITLCRDEICDARLKDSIAAKTYQSTTPHHIALAVAPLLRMPDFDSSQDTEALYGQGFDVLIERGDYALGRLESGYVGWMDKLALEVGAISITHRVCALGAPMFTRPDLKSPIAQVLSLNSRLQVSAVEGDYAATPDGYVHRLHIAPIDGGFADDPVSIAAQFIGQPYIWGGNSAAGLDCSGLIQMAYWACGKGCPRDTDQQQAALGKSIDVNALLQRGDLIFWAGHVGIMEDAETLLHANAYHMLTAREPLTQAAQRIEKSAGPIIAVKRIS